MNTFIILNSFAYCAKSWEFDEQGSKCGGGGGFTPQRNDPVGLKLRAVGLKIMRLFTCSALRSKLNIFETRDRLRLLSIELEICSNGSNSSEVI